MVSLQAVEQASAVLSQVASKTPLVYSNSLSRQSGARIYLKLENLQKTGSFKFRGAYHKLVNIKDELGPLGVVAASAGNHAQGVALAAQLMRIPATIVMPQWASISKQIATRSYGGEVILSGKTIAESLAIARRLEKEGRRFIHPYDDEEVIAGQGSIGLEILEQLPEVDAILVPVGGGGLIAGIATAVKSRRPRVSIIGVQTAACPAALAARRHGQPVAVPAARTIADGINVRQIGQLTFPIIEQLVDELVEVEEEQIAAAILELLERKKVLAEGSGAVPLAALLGKRLRQLQNKSVVLVVSGGNVDSHLLGKILRQGLFRSGRILRFSVELADVPGSLADLLDIIAQQGGNIIHIFHDRMGRHLPLGVSRVELELETRGADHTSAILEVLAAKDYSVDIR
ncbi:MAG: threonine ammonia-lyase [Deltaproteobacteria bacterium]|nr:threonine ammonia-lyase [Deltaproteobacteria bacterium]MBW2069958.1 threonine ammonia-lyase [Deltaproteobacteria bacterium]